MTWVAIAELVLTLLDKLGVFDLLKKRLVLRAVYRRFPDLSTATPELIEAAVNEEVQS